jgi:hypothetical protein
MGRGRAKAKQTKVARRLKYDSGGTDLDQLRAELIGGDDEVNGGEDGHGQSPRDPYDPDDEGVDEQDDAASR